MSKAFSRKDLKHQDEFLTGATYLAQWFIQRRKSIGLILLIVIAAVSVLLGMRSYRLRQEQDAAAMLAVALRIYNSPVVPETEGSIAVAEADEHGTGGHTHYPSLETKLEASVAALEPIVQEHPARPSGRMAAFYLGNALANLGQSDAAIAALEQAAKSSAPMLEAMARLRLGHLYVDLERYEYAVAAFRPLTENPPEGFPVEEALASKARAHEAAGDPQSAMLAYQRIVEDHPTSIYATVARTHAQELAASLGVDLDIES